MANLTYPELIDRIADILLTDIRDNTNLSGDSNNQFDPNHIDIPTLPRSFDKMLSDDFGTDNVIQALNELLGRVESVENSLTNNLNQQFSVIGDFLAFPAKKDNMEKYAPDILEALTQHQQEINGPDLDNPVNIQTWVASQTTYNAPLSQVGSTISIVQASTSTDGYLSSTDWNSFDSKQDSLSFTSPLTEGGGFVSITQATTSTDGYLSSTDWNTFDSKEDTLTFNSPISRVGDTVSIPAASTSTDGYLSSTDWNAFDSKEDTLTFNGPLDRSGDTISIIEASAGATGALSSTDWNTFNSKEDTLTFNGPLDRSGDTISIIEASAGATGALSSADWNTFNSKEDTLTFNGPLDRTGDTISIIEASAGATGALSSADWNTFNSKADSNAPIFTGTSTFNGAAEFNSTVTITTAPTLPNHAATKSYVDALSAGLDPKESVQYATISDITDFGVQGTVEAALDQVGASTPTLVSGDRVLVRAQTTQTENGIYSWNGSALVRAEDHDGSPSAEVSAGNFTFVELGDTYANSGWVLQDAGGSNAPEIDLGTDNLVWIQFSGAGQLNAGDGLTKVGDTLNVNVTGPITITGDSVTIPQANGSTDGYLDQTDWSTFNSKEEALTFNAPVSRVGNVISIAQATTSVDGYLSSTDWNTFNSKEDTLTFNGPLDRSGDTISIIEASAGATGVLNSTDWNTFNSKEDTLTFNGPISRVGNTVSIPQASTTVDGYLTSTDWNTFNDKLSSSNVVDNLNSTSATDVLSANQGSVIKEGLFEVSGGVYHVDVNRTDSFTENGSKGWPYKTLEDLITNVTFSAGDVIQLSSGTHTVPHNSTVSLVSRMTFSGMGNTTLLQAELNSSASSSTNIITVPNGTSQVTIKDMKISGNNNYAQPSGDPSRQVKGTNDDAQNAVFIDGASEVRITGCYFEESTLDAIRIKDSTDCIVTENILKNNGRQAVIEVGSSNGNIIDNNINSNNGQQEF